jgi:hypothetical protein
LGFFPLVLRAQIFYQPYSYSFYQRLNRQIFSPTSDIHTALKPFILSPENALYNGFDSLLQPNTQTKTKSLLNRILFYGHLVDIKNKDFTFYLDFLPDFQLGREFVQPKTLYLNTRGYQLGGTIGPHFFYYSSGYENQAALPNYQAAYVNKTGMIYGQAYDRSLITKGTDWSYVTSVIGYSFSKRLTLVLGEDKTFIGDGYRSILLSDYAAAYPLFRIKADLGSGIQYMAMWTYMEDQKALEFNSFTNNRRKWGLFHYIDWNINSKASFGLFNALISEEANDQGHFHGFDINFLNPVYFISSLGPANPAPDHTLLGFNAKYRFLPKTLAYGQFLIDQGRFSDNSSKNAWQLGVRGSDLFKINRLNYLLEFNTSKPYTYTSAYPITNYAQLNEPLADPIGANFKEWIGILSYNLGKFEFQGELNYSRFGLDENYTNYGLDITESNQQNLPSTIGGTGQGLSTQLKFAEGSVAYILNPKYNLRLELNGVFRQESNVQTETKTLYFTLGLRSSFRNLYHDF